MKKWAEAKVFWRDKSGVRMTRGAGEGHFCEAGSPHSRNRRVPGGRSLATRGGRSPAGRRSAVTLPIAGAIERRVEGQIRTAYRADVGHNRSLAS